MTHSHLYVGPTTKWGLRSRTPCTVVGSRAGGIHIRTGEGRTWLVGRDELIPHRPRKSARERVIEFLNAA